jgi:hypothetical protein
MCDQGQGKSGPARRRRKEKKWLENQSPFEDESDLTDPRSSDDEMPQ